MTITAAVLNVMPKVNSKIQVYFTIILPDNSLNQGVISNIDILYGNVSISNTSIITPGDNIPAAIGVTASYNGDTYFAILYYKAVYSLDLPNNTQRFVQKIPRGIFNDLSKNSVMGQIASAIGSMTNDYYTEYFNAQNAVYSTSYSQQLEYEFNGTVGLLSNSVYPDELFQLFATLNNVYLNEYDLTLFVTKYIYYRLGISCAVYINDHVNQYDNYWALGVVGRSELDVTTILAPDSYTPVVQNLDWTIYNTNIFSNQFKIEIQQLIIRISRADIGNPVTFSTIVSPTSDGFILIGPTYKLDPRLIFDKCLEYVGDSQFPLNIIGYKKTY